MEETWWELPDECRRKMLSSSASHIAVETSEKMRFEGKMTHFVFFQVESCNFTTCISHLDPFHLASKCVHIICFAIHPKMATGNVILWKRNNYYFIYYCYRKIWKGVNTQIFYFELQTTSALPKLVLSTDELTRN